MGLPLGGLSTRVNSSEGWVNELALTLASAL